MSKEELREKIIDVLYDSSSSEELKGEVLSKLRSMLAKGELERLKREGRRGGARGTYGVEGHLAVWLRDSSPVVRAGAAAVMGDILKISSDLGLISRMFESMHWINYNRGIGSLLRLLSDESANVRRWSVRALGLFDIKDYRGYYQKELEYYEKVLEYFNSHPESKDLPERYPEHYKDKLKYLSSNGEGCYPDEENVLLNAIESIASSLLDADFNVKMEAAGALVCLTKKSVLESDWYLGKMKRHVSKFRKENGLVLQEALFDVLLTLLDTLCKLNKTDREDILDLFGSLRVFPIGLDYSKRGVTTKELINQMVDLLISWLSVDTVMTTRLRALRCLWSTWLSDFLRASGVDRRRVIVRAAVELLSLSDVDAQKEAHAIIRSFVASDLLEYMCNLSDFFDTLFCLIHPQGKFRKEALRTLRKTISTNDSCMVRAIKKGVCRVLLKVIYDGLTRYVVLKIFGYVLLKNREAKDELGKWGGVACLLGLLQDKKYHFAAKALMQAIYQHPDNAKRAFDGGLVSVVRKIRQFEGEDVTFHKRIGPMLLVLIGSYPQSYSMVRKVISLSKQTEIFLKSKERRDIRDARSVFLKVVTSLLKIKTYREEMLDLDIKGIVESFLGSEGSSSYNDDSESDWEIKDFKHEEIVSDARKFLDKLSQPLLQSEEVSVNVEARDAFSMIPLSELVYGDFIGSGSYANVYKAFWGVLNVAVKELKSQSMNPEEYTCFRREAEIMEKIPPHPNIIVFYGVSLDLPKRSFVFEYLPRGNLMDWLTDLTVKLDWKSKKKEALALGIARGLWHLHQNDIMHCDLKSPNVLLKQVNGEKVEEEEVLIPVLSDFGLAKVKRSTMSCSSSVSLVGSPLWMPPEASSPTAIQTKKWDVYAFGMIAWEIASRERPWKNAVSPFSVLFSVMQGKRETVPKGTPSKFAAIIKRCWAQDPGDRPSMESVVSELKVLGS